MHLYRNIILVLMVLCVHKLSAQGLLGSVYDADSKDVLPSATVFISGTTKGTYTDNNGAFELNDVSYPCQLSISMVGYKSQALLLKEEPKMALSIFLEEQKVELEKVSVEAKSNRQNNLIHFENNFLGIGQYRMDAKLKNQDQLFFKVKKERKNTRGLPFEKRTQLEVLSNDLLQIEVPGLGYNVKVDLRDFTLRYGKLFQGDTIHYNGLYYFEPYQKTTRKQAKNRKIAYYNSRIHFLRSLYKKELGVNGYLVMEVIKDPQSKFDKYVPFDIYNYMKVDQEKRQVILSGVEGKNLSVLYYGKPSKPRNIQKYKKRGNPIASPLLPLSNHILITKEGTDPYNHLLIGGEMGKKQVGSMLPLDYYPPE